MTHDVPVYAKLQVVGDTPEEVSIDGLSVTLGCSPDNDVVLECEGVVDYHLRLVKTTYSYRVMDLGNGVTRLNDDILNPMQFYTLDSGDTLTLGTTKVNFLVTSLPLRDQELESTMVDPISRPVFDLESFDHGAASSRQTVVMTGVNPLLRVILPGDIVEDYVITKPITRIGRDPACDIPINSPFVSGHHAEIRQFGSDFEIIDLGSKNVLRHRGQVTYQKVLKDGDEFSIATVRLQFLLNPNASDPNDNLVQVLTLGDRNSILLGRDGDCDVVIEHPTVSLKHAQIFKQGKDYFIVDLSSSNGTYVEGKKVTSRRALVSGDTIRVGPVQIVFTPDGTLLRQNEAGRLQLDCEKLTKVVQKETVILFNISLSILPRELVAIVGQSGSGKSSLLKVLSGSQSASQGKVLVNGKNLHDHLDAYRAEIGLVPQDDIVHQDLSVGQALLYAAKLRMPSDVTDRERELRVQDVLNDLGLLDHHGTLIKNLSGGQRKRVSIGVELITQPSLLFLDEATSGLDPGIETQMMQLLRKLADQGRVVMIVTHATKNVMLCDQVIFLAKGGHLAYFGPPKEALKYFKVSDFDQIYTQLSAELDSKVWHEKYQTSPDYETYVKHRWQSAQKSTPPKRMRAQAYQSGLNRISFHQELAVLSQRNLEIFIRDRASLVLMLGVAPLLGLFDLISWKSNMFDLQDGDSGQAITMLFVMSLVGVLLGTLSTMREIVKEVEIYRREHMVGLQIGPYILSKVWLGVVFAFYQAAIFLFFKMLAIDFLIDYLGLIQLYITLVLTIVAGMMLGLVISACSPTQNVAPLLAVTILVPQIIFGGSLLPINTLGPAGQWLNHLTVTKWSFETLVSASGLGRVVAEDPEFCRSQLLDTSIVSNSQSNTEEECRCIGPQLFKECQFPGIRAFATPALDESQPVRPQIETLSPSRVAFKLDEWQEDYTRWQIGRAKAEGEAQGLLKQMYRNYGQAFKVNLWKHWGILGLQILGMLGLVLAIQWLKDLWPITFR